MNYGPSADVVRVERPLPSKDMTTLENRPHTALLVIDVQNDLVARADGVAVIWVQHADDDLPEGSDAWQIVPELTPAAVDPLIGKSFGDAFEHTTLEVGSRRTPDRPPGGDRRPDRSVRALHDPRRVHPRLRRHPGLRRAHRGGPQPVGSAAAGAAGDLEW